MEKYEDLGTGNFGVDRLMRNRETNELVSVKFIERGHQIDDFVEWQIINLRSLTHPNVIRFKEVALTATHLAIVMENAAGGALFDRISNAGPFSEDEARNFFQQLICGVSYCHFMQICNQDLKLDSILLKESSLAQLKICDFSYSESSLLHTIPQLTVGNLAYIAPEVLFCHDYRFEARKFLYDSNEVLEFLYKVERNRPLTALESDICIVLEEHKCALMGAEADLYLRRCKWYVEKIDRAERQQPISDTAADARDEYKEGIPKLVAKAELADVWSCGVALYLMLVGAYVFQDPADPENLALTIERIMVAEYKIPDHVHISQDCQQLLARIFVADPDERIKIQEIRQHPWFLENLPEELSEAAQAVYYERDNTAQIHSLQTTEDIIQIVNEARNPQVEEAQVAPEVEAGRVEEEDIEWYQEMFVMPSVR